MRKSLLIVFMMICMSINGYAVKSEAGVDIVFNLPAIRFYATPALVVIPHTYVYIIPDIGMDILFYEGYWWRPHHGHWYRSKNYDGRWSYIDNRRIPHGLRSLPNDNRHRLSPDYERVHYKDVKNNWKRWEKEKHWDQRPEQRRNDRAYRSYEKPGDQNHGRYDDQKHGRSNDKKSGRNDSDNRRKNK